MALDTPSLVLIPCAPPQILALIESAEQFEQLAGYPATPGFHEMWASDEVSPAWLAALRDSDDPDPWRYGFFVVERGSGAAIGAAGFKGPPDDAGMVEIAYGIDPQFQNRGYATEAARALVDYALAAPEVKLVRAHTLPTNGASTRVLAKCGFQRVGEIVDPDDGLVWRWVRGH